MADRITATQARALMAYWVPVLPPSLNEYKRWHWAKQERERKIFQEALWAALNEKGRRCSRGYEGVMVRSVLTFTKARRRDSDNYGAVLAKWLQDVLVNEGIIPDDTADRCTCMPPAIVTGGTEQTFFSIEGARDTRRASE